MLFASAHVRVTAEYGTATLWLDFPGEPVNALDRDRLAELDAAAAAVAGNPAVRILVVRSAKPAGFCAGAHPAALASLTTAADRAAFAAHGQRVLDRLARLPCETLAFVDGPCVGAGLELALACDHRLVLSGPRTHLGFPDAPRGVPPAFGGAVRLRRLLGRRAADRLLGSGGTLSGREARALGLVHHAFCERRAKIELRTYLDRLETRPFLRDPADAPPGLAAERRAFAAALSTAASRAAVERQLDAVRPVAVDPPPVNPVPPFPAVVGLAGDGGAASRLVADAVLLGGSAVVRGSARGVRDGIAAALARGFVTPLEAEQANGRVANSDDLTRAGLVFVSAGNDPPAGLRPRCIVVSLGPSAGLPPPTRSLTLAVRPDGTAHLVPHPHTDSDALAAAAAWLRHLGVHAAPAAPRAAARAAA